MSLLRLALMLATPAFAGGFFSEPLTLPDGSFFCCTKRYAPCEEQCRASCLGMSACEPKLECAATCRKDHCQPGQNACQSDAPGKGAPAMSLRYDGQVTGPGVVRFNIHRSGATLPRLAVYGIVYGKRHQDGQIEVLTKTDTHAVHPGKPLHFELSISADDFADWSKRCDDLTVAIALPSEKDRARWTYRNELTAQDADNAKPGEMQVKGEFLWTEASP